METLRLHPFGLSRNPIYQIQGISIILKKHNKSVVEY